MFNRKALVRRHSDFFVSAKAPSPIRARHPELREALVQASLDPAVRSISHIATANVASSRVEVDAIVLARGGGRYQLDVVAARRLRDPEGDGLRQSALLELGLKPFTVTIEDLQAEPRCSNCRLVWSHHRRYVPVGLLIRILRALRDDGPLELGHLLESVRAARDPTSSMMSLACDNLLELDLTSQPVGPSTIVRSRT
jgi:hypothetical protein